MDRFFSLSARAHASEPTWVHPEYGIQRRLLDGSSAFRQRSEAAAWLVADAARAAAFRDPRYGDTGLIGLVESLPGREADLRLAYEGAESWLTARGAQAALVPIAGHVLYGFGFLAEAFDRPAVVGTTWSRPDDIRVAESIGYRVARRFLNYVVLLDDRTVAKARNLSQSDFAIQKVNRRRMKPGMLAMTRLRNRTFADLWGDAQMHDDEGWELFRRMRPVLVPDLALLAHADDRPAGFLLAFPDFNQAFASLGREPRGPRAAVALARRRITRGAVGEVGVLPEFRGRGLATALVARAAAAMASRGYEELHYLLVLEENTASRRTIEKLGGRIYSSHVVLEKVL